MEFLSGLNIITDESRGSGKSTILRAILKAVHPTGQMEYPPSPTKGFSEGDISVEFMSPNVTLRISDSASIPSDKSSNEQAGQNSLKRLRSHLETAQPGTALLLDSEAFDVLNAHAYAEAFKLLNAPPCQVICIMSPRLKPLQFSQARIYVCFWNEETNKASVRLHQNECSKLQEGQLTSSNRSQTATAACSVRPPCLVACTDCPDTVALTGAFADLQQLAVAHWLAG